MNNSDLLTQLAPLVDYLREKQMSEPEIRETLLQLSQRIEIGALWGLAQSRGDDLAQLATLTADEKRSYVDSFSAQEYQAALQYSIEHYMTDFIDTITANPN